MVYCISNFETIPNGNSYSFTGLDGREEKSKNQLLNNFKQSVCQILNPDKFTNEHMSGDDFDVRFNLLLKTIRCTK